MENKDLIKLAIEAKQNAHVPYSRFKVGAALLTKSGKVYQGANMECSSYGMTVCAERVALVKALYDGEKEFEKIAVVGGKEDELTYTTPCGACRQFLADFGVELEVIMGYMEDNELKEKVFKLKELLPESFEL
ncbi:MAG: cytidine deaminase [Clostridia bacterium]|nr:cytidine deaminase [Clostridia bacterium]